MDYSDARSGSQCDGHTVGTQSNESHAGLRGHKCIDTGDDTGDDTGIETGAEIGRGHDRNVSPVDGIQDSPASSAYLGGYAIEIRLHTHRVVAHMTCEIEAVERRLAYPSRTTGGHPYCRVATG